MMNNDNPIRIPSPIDTSRLWKLEHVVMLDALSNGVNRHAVTPDDLDSKEAKALLASIRPGRTRTETREAAVRVLVDAFGVAPMQASPMIDDYLSLIDETARDEGKQNDTLAAHAAVTLRQARAIREADAAEADARKAAEAAPTPETRKAYADALSKADAARRDVPATRRHLSSMLDAVMDRARSSQGKAAVGLETPRYPGISGRLFGWRGLCILASAPGIGKTTLALAAGIDAVRHNPDACLVFVSFEMPTDTLVERVLCDMAGIPQRTFRTGKIGLCPGDETGNGLRLPQDADHRLSDALAELHKLSQRVSLVGKHDVGTLVAAEADGRDCMSKVASLVVEAKRRSGAKRSFVVVDYLAVVPVERRDGEPFANDTDRIRFILSGLTTLRDALNGDENPVVVIAQSRKTDYESVSLASIMGTADTTYSADAVIALQRETEGAEKPSATDPQRLVAKIVKGRDMMMHGEVRLEFDPRSSSITEIET
jgi:hypothetical protein